MRISVHFGNWQIAHHSNSMYCPLVDSIQEGSYVVSSLAVRSPAFENLLPWVFRVYLTFSNPLFVCRGSLYNPVALYFIIRNWTLGIRIEFDSKNLKTPRIFEFLNFTEIQNLRIEQIWVFEVQKSVNHSDCVH